MSFSPKFAETSSHFDTDLATLSNYKQIRTTHIDLDWTIDWDKQVIYGQAELSLVASDKVEEIVLDSSYLAIKEVQVGGNPVDWSHGDRIGAMGEGLKIKLDQALRKDQVRGSSWILRGETDDVQEIKVKIVYSTTKECTAVGWLNPVCVKSQSR
jgi:leukotriene-A4 hydrolase